MAANKRMFSKDVVESDKFLDLPFNSQLLYFHLGLNGDLRGFVEPKKVIRMVGLKSEDLRPLIENGLVLLFNSGVIVITHWSVNNNLREDRESETRFLGEFEQLSCTNNEYQLQEYSSSTAGGIPPRLGKVRLGKDRLGKDRLGKERERNTQEVSENNKDIKKIKYRNIEDIGSAVIEELSEKYNVPQGFVENSMDNLVNYCEAHGKVYKNYKSALINFLKGDIEKHGKEVRKNTKPRAIDAEAIIKNRTMAS